jgi:hypothetical protein
VAYWLGASLLLALISLAAARYLDSPAWIDALLGTGASLGLAVAMTIGLAARRLFGAERWLGVAAIVLALAAAVGRTQLLAQVGLVPVPTIDFPRLALAASTVVWGAVALGWGSLTLSDGLGERRRRGAAILGGSAVALALYSLAPLWHLLGLRINHWTVLGLFGLAAVAYGLGQGWRRVLRWRHERE